jgi:hypothetical protein
MPEIPNPSEAPNRTLHPQYARQGETSGRMRYVLGVSLFVAAIAVLGLAYDWHEARQPPAPPTSPAATSAQPNTTPNALQSGGQVPNNTSPSPPSDH